MKITIMAETDQERASLAEPFVRTGCLRFGLAGMADRTEENKTGEFGFLHGDAIGIRGDVARLLGSLDMQDFQRASVNGLLQANQIIANAQRDAALAQEIAANRNGPPLRLHRP